LRAKIILILAIIMGGITTFMFVGYMQRFDEAAVVNESLTEVVTAKGPIKREQKITAAMLQVVQVPSLGVHPQAVKTIAEVEGKIANADIVTGETLLSTRLTTEQEESLFVARKVKEGHRAISVGVNLVQSVSNLVEPEDYVDVIYTPEPKGDVIVPSTLLAEKVRVLAIGRRMVEAKTDAKSDANAETSGGGADKEQVLYTSVTLEVTPRDAISIINSDEMGRISLSLHTRVKPAASPAPQAK